jgi:hypothetical protein
MSAGLAVVPQLTIFEGRMDDAPQMVVPEMVVIDDGEKYAITVDDNRLRDLFTANSGLVPILNAIEDAVQGFTLDAATAKGRAEIKSLAHKITRSKTYLDGIGKDMVAELKDLPRRIDANRKMMRDQLELLAEETRRPLTEWETRTKAISDQLNAIDALPVTLATATSARIGWEIETLTKMELTAEVWEGFLDEATAITRRTIPILTEMCAARRKAELDAAELEQLRIESAKREQKDAEAKRIAEAQERGRREAEQRAESERQAALGREAEANRQATLARQREADADRRAKEAEYERILAENRAIVERETARVEAIAAERKRQEDEAKQARREKEAREADKDHRKQINGEVLADIKAVFEKTYCFDSHPAISPENVMVLVKAVTIAIIKGQVRHTSITY